MTSVLPTGSFLWLLHLWGEKTAPLLLLLAATAKLLASLALQLDVSATGQDLSPSQLPVYATVLGVFAVPLVAGFVEHRCCPDSPEHRTNRQRSAGAEQSPVDSHVESLAASTPPPSHADGRRGAGAERLLLALDFAFLCCVAGAELAVLELVFGHSIYAFAPLAALLPLRLVSARCLLRLDILLLMAGVVLLKLTGKGTLEAGCALAALGVASMVPATLALLQTQLPVTPARFYTFALAAGLSGYAQHELIYQLDWSGRTALSNVLLVNTELAAVFLGVISYMRRKSSRTGA